MTMWVLTLILIIRVLTIQMPLIIIKGKVRNLSKKVVLKYQVTQISISLWAMEFPLLLLSTSAYLSIPFPDWSDSKSFSSSDWSLFDSSDSAIKSYITTDIVASSKERVDNGYINPQSKLIKHHSHHMQLYQFLSQFFRIKRTPFKGGGGCATFWNQK